MKPRILAAALLALSSAASWAQASDPLKLLSTTPLPEVTGGDFDHFAVDLRHHRLFVVAEDYASIESFDLSTGKHLQSVRGVVKSPRKIAFVEAKAPGEKDQLLVLDGGAAACDFLDASDLHLISSVPLEPGPDAGAYDPKARIFYIGNGGRGAHQPFAYVSKLSVDTHQVTDRIRVDATTLKTVVLDPDTQKIYVTLRDKSQIAVLDLKTNTVAATWSNPELHTDSALAFDPEHHRLFVGDRGPGKLIVLNTDNDSIVATLPIGDTSDDMTYDAAHRRIYISTADGLDVIGQDSPDSYRLLQHIDTLGGKTSIYIPSLKRFYVVHTKGDKASEAGLQIFAVR
jgi:DNA-binding beta-propeller fold protein YncE